MATLVAVGKFRAELSSLDAGKESGGNGKGNGGEFGHFEVGLYWNIFERADELGTCGLES